jgi:OFA family oxalate/formate antiporter-like MFS transporter
MFLTFGIEAVLVFLVTKIAGAPLAFVALFSFIFLFWGEIYSLFSATVGDVFGAKNASADYGMVYTSKGLASIFAGFGAAALAAYFSGSFSVPFYISAVLCGVASILALFVLKPLIRGRIAEESRLAEGMALTAALAQASTTAETEKHLTGVR